MSVAIDEAREASDVVLQGRDDMLALFEQRDIFRDVSFSLGKTTTTTTTTTVDPALAKPWTEYVKMHCKFMGRSPNKSGVMEAIIIDRKTGKMHIGAAGGGMVADKKALRLGAIAKDYVEITDGETTIKIN